MTEKKLHGTVLLFAAAVLLAIWPLPRTIGIRHLLLLIGSIASLVVLTQNTWRLKHLKAWPVYLLLFFFPWIVLHLIFLSSNYEEQWHELTSDWLRSFLAASMGLALGVVLSDPAHQLSSRLQRIQQPILILGFGGTIIIFSARYVYEVIQTGLWLHMNFYMTPYLGKISLVIFGSLFLPIMFIKILAALRQTERPIWYLYGLLGIAATVLTYYVANTKNGFAMSVLLFGYFLFHILTSNTHIKTHRTGFYVLLLVCLLMFGFVVKKHLDSNPAWSNLVADYKISSQIDQHTNWKDQASPLPLNEYGIQVNGSTYERVAWWHAGLKLLQENPWGYGLINHSFGALAIQKWTNFHKPDGKNRGATHSGWLDFALGFGIPGLLLLWIPLLVSYIRARRRTDFWSTYAVWTIPVIAISYLTTEVCSDHFIELLFFMTALFSGLTLPGGHEASGANVD